MKKVLIFMAFLIPLANVGAYTIVKEYSSGDYIAHIQMSDSDVRVYKVDDSTDPNVKCYVAYHDFTVYNQEKGNQTSLSCVKVK